VIVIRRVDTAAFKWVLKHLQLETLPGDRPFNTDKGAWWIAFDGAVPVAFAGSTNSTRWSDAMYLCRAGVVESHRGLGLQKRLIRVRESHARRQGANWAITDTHTNPASANNLLSRGYRLYEPAAPWGKRGALYWRKNLRTTR
jgi:GNAT superfamily N-acetyltransferase